MLSINRTIPTAELPGRYKAANRRLIVVGYDDVLVPRTTDPGLTIPSSEARKIIQHLNREEGNTVVILSNRDTRHLEKYWFDSNAILVAENGALYHEPGKKWNSVFDFNATWISKIAPAINALAFQFEGSFVERKDTSIVWHYGTGRPADAEIRQVTAAIRALSYGDEFEMYPGRDFLELHTRGIDPASFVARWIANRQFDLIIALGDARMDESLFGLFTKTAILIRVSPGMWTQGNYTLDRQDEVLPLLQSLCNPITLNTQ